MVGCSVCWDDANECDVLTLLQSLNPLSLVRWRLAAHAKEGSCHVRPAQSISVNKVNLAVVNRKNCSLYADEFPSHLFFAFYQRLC